LIKGKSVDEVIEYAIKQHLEELGYVRREQPLATVASRIKKVQEDVDKKIKSLESRVEELIRERDALREEVKRLRKEVEELSFELRYATRVEVDESIVKDRIVTELRERIKVLTQQLESAKAQCNELRNELSKALYVIELVALGKLEAVPRIPRLSAECLSDVEELVRSKRIVFVEREEVDLDVIPLIRELGLTVLMPKCSEDVKRTLWSKAIAVDCGYEPAYATDRLALFDSNTLAKGVERACSLMKSFLEELERQRRKELSLEKLKKIIEEYRRSLAESSKSGLI